MRIQFLLLITLIMASASSDAQTTVGTPRLKVFLDCKSHCDEDFIRTEINIVDFMNLRQLADLHILNFTIETGGGGLAYELIILGQNKFSGRKDTLHFNIRANTTEFERRDLQVKYLKLALIPYLTANNDLDNVQISMVGKNKETDTTKKTKMIAIEKICAVFDDSFILVEASKPESF